MHCEMTRPEFYTQPILLTSAGKIGVIEADGSAERYFDFGIANQASWGIGPVFPDGQRIILTSYEDLTTSKLVVGEVKSHLWIYDFVEESLEEIVFKENLASFISCAGIIGFSKVLLTALIDGENRLFTANLDGEILAELTASGEGFVYGIHLSPDQKHIAFHITGSKNSTKDHYHAFRPGPYAINVIEVDGKNRTLVAGEPGHLYFDPVWSPDGEWLAYVDCHHEQDPAHFAADLCIGRPDGSEHHVVTSGQSHWFGTSYGTHLHRGGGSNTTQWSPDGQNLLYTRLLPGSHPDCFYDPTRPDHEELVYQPELAQGGSHLCTVNPFSGEIKALTEPEEGKWEHHASYTKNNAHIVYGRANVGKDNELWIIEAESKRATSPNKPHLLTRGHDGYGAWGYGFPDIQLHIPKNNLLKKDNM